MGHPHVHVEGDGEGERFDFLSSPSPVANSCARDHIPVYTPKRTISGCCSAMI